jgi:hypothetical protein
MVHSLKAQWIIRILTSNSIFFIVYLTNLFICIQMDQYGDFSIGIRLMNSCRVGMDASAFTIIQFGCPL